MREVIGILEAANIRKIMEMSLSGAALILAAVIIRAFGLNRLPKKTFSALWCAALFRLLIPVSLPSPFSIYTLLRRALPSQASPASFYRREVPALGTGGAMEGVQTALGVMETGDSFPYGTVIWAGGVLLLAVIFGILYFRCQRTFRASLPVREEYAERWLKDHRILRKIEIRQSDQIPAPLTYGLIRPVILLPKKLSLGEAGDLEYILAHEYVHIRRFHGAVKLVLVFALCLHWWNPLVWVMYFLANRDLELICDEAVVNQFGMDSRRGYALAIIHMAESRGGAAPLCSSFSKHPVEERIEAIMKTKKTTLFSGTIAVLLAAAVTAAFATSASATKGNPGPPETAVVDEIQLSRQGEDGRMEYSIDGGKTFLDEKAYEDLNSGETITWWTAEEYAAWLEEEKESLSSIIGSMSWNPTEGWYTWTPKKVEETIQMYEEILEEIKRGAKISKDTSMDGFTGESFASEEREAIQETVVGECFETSEAAWDEADGYAAEISNTAMDTASGDACESGNISETMDLIARYAPFGVTFVKSSDFGNLYWNGELVASLEDDGPDGMYTTISSSGQGGMKIRTVYDKEGNLVGIEKK